MSEPNYAKGATSDTDRHVLTSRRQTGGVEVHTTNTGEANGLTVTVEGAPSDPKNPSVARWEDKVTVHGPANVAGDASNVFDVTAANAEASGLDHYRILVRSQATGAPTTYSVVAQDGKE